MRCELENEYIIRAGGCNDPEVKENTMDVFKCNEHSACYKRMCCPPYARPFDMDISYMKMVDNDGNFNLDWTPFLKLVRDYKFTLLCWNRPVLIVKLDYNEAKEVIGTIVNEFNPCEFEFTIYEGTSSQPSYKIRGDYLQCGICLQSSCGPGKEAFFRIYNLKDHNKFVGLIKKVWSGFFKEYCSKGDEYVTGFSPSDDWKYKILIMATILFMDYCYFEDKIAQ